MAVISVDPGEMTALASACQQDSGEILRLSTTLGAHVAGAGLNLLLAYGIGITSIVDRLAHLAGGPTGVLRVAYRFDENAQSVVRSRDAFLRADGQAVPTSLHRWPGWALLESADDVTEALRELGTFARTVIVGEHQAQVGLGLFLSIASSLAKATLGGAGEVIYTVGTMAKSAGDVASRGLEEELAAAERRFARTGADVTGLGKKVVNLGEEIGGAAGRRVVTEAEGIVKDGEALSGKARMLGNLRVVDKVLGPVSVLLDGGFVVKDVLAPEGGKIDDWDVTLDTAQVFADVAMVSGVPPAVAVGAIATGVIAGAKYYKDHTEQVNDAVGKAVDLAARLPGLSPAADLAKYYKDHPEINQPVNHVIKAVGNEAAHLVAGSVVNDVQGAADVVTGEARQLHGFYDLATGDPVKGGREVVSGGLKAAGGVLKALDPF